MYISESLKYIPEVLQDHILEYHPLLSSKNFRAYKKNIYINGIYSCTFGLTKDMYMNELKRPCVLQELDTQIIKTENLKKTRLFIYTANVLLNTNDTNF